MDNTTDDFERSTLYLYELERDHLRAHLAFDSNRSAVASTLPYAHAPARSIFAPLLASRVERCAASTHDSRRPMSGANRALCDWRKLDCPAPVYASKVVHSGSA
eukprot:561695-Pleurochrysis_carterae.AAC.2